MRQNCEATMNKPSAPASNDRNEAGDADAGHAADDREDGLLVERAVGGDGEAFEALFTKYRQRLFGVVWRVLKNEDAALDVVQDAFVKAYQGLDQLRGETRFYPWLRRIAVNQAIDRLRHIRR